MTVAPLLPHERTALEQYRHAKAHDPRAMLDLSQAQRRYYEGLEIMAAIAELRRLQERQEREEEGRVAALRETAEKLGVNIKTSFEERREALEIRESRYRNKCGIIGTAYLEATKRVTGVLPITIRSHYHRKTPAVSSARKSLTVALRKGTEFSMPAIGCIMNRDHTTVLYSLRTATAQEREMGEDICRIAERKIMAELMK